MSTKHRPVVEKKYYVIAKALKLTNGSPVAQQIVHDLYNKGYLIDPNATPQAGDEADILTELDDALTLLDRTERDRSYGGIS